jgi:hypothetical protein
MSPHAAAWPYPIGVPGTPWTAQEKEAWVARQRVQRSYHEHVVSKLEALGAPFESTRYGALTLDPSRYPLFSVTLRCSQPSAPWALITGGVHGYETSGVQGALAFLASHAERYRERVNLLVVPCVSPWSYEVIHRWNARALDPNRSFAKAGQAEESLALMQHVEGLGVRFALHLDLHETTDSDETEFRPALAARDGKNFEPNGIPDGFYLVADSANPAAAFQAAVIEAVAHVTHIAPPDAEGNIIGSPVTQPGVIHYDFKALGLCAGMTDARFTSTTEVYPDSPKATPATCNAAQVAAICAALDYALANA